MYTHTDIHSHADIDTCTNKCTHAHKNLSVLEINETYQDGYASLSRK